MSEKTAKLKDEIISHYNKLMAKSLGDPEKGKLVSLIIQIQYHVRQLAEEELAIARLRLEIHEEKERLGI